MSVDWTGENPCLFLKQTPDGPFTALATFFRVVWSPHGRGHACFVLEAPRDDRPDVNVCLTDNEPLARWLAVDFVRHFGAFRGAQGLDTVCYVSGGRFTSHLDGRRSYTERCRGASLDIEIAWQELSDPVMVDLPPEKSATSRHHMYNVVIDAHAAMLLVNERRVPGSPAPREFLGRRSTTAFLAFSETWVAVEPGGAF